MYTIKIEFLRGPFQDDSADKSASITVDGLVIGGEVDSSRQNFECNFEEYSSLLTMKEITSNTGSISVSIRYGNRSDDCDCDRSTWKCTKDLNQDTENQLRIHSAARITLFPKVHSSGNLV